MQFLLDKSEPESTPNLPEWGAKDDISLLATEIHNDDFHPVRSDASRQLAQKEIRHRPRLIHDLLGDPSLILGVCHSSMLVRNCHFLSPTGLESAI